MKNGNLESLYQGEEYIFKSQAALAEKFVIRLPDGMRDCIAGVSRRNHRSMNSQIVAYLNESLSNNETISIKETVFRFETLSDNERRLLQSFRKMASRQRVAVLSLLTE